MSFRDGAAGSALIGISFRQMRRNLPFSLRVAPRAYCASLREIVRVSTVRASRARYISSPFTRQYLAPLCSRGWWLRNDILALAYCKMNALERTSAARHRRRARVAAVAPIVFFRHGAEMPLGCSANSVTRHRAENDDFRREKGLPRIYFRKR